MKNLRTVPSYSLYLLMVSTKFRYSQNNTHLTQAKLIYYVTTLYHQQYDTYTYSHAALENSTF
jgi:hypothetical protein